MSDIVFNRESTQVRTVSSYALASRWLKERPWLAGCTSFAELFEKLEENGEGGLAERMMAYDRTRRHLGMLPKE